MSVDKLRGSRHINVIKPSDIGLLIAAQSYRPDVTNAIRKIKQFDWLPLQNMVENTISPGPHPVYGGSYPCLKTKNVQDLIADSEPADFADVSGLSKLENAQVCRGDLLINLTGAGSIGRVSVYYGDNKPITNQHIARMSIKPAYDEGYVAAFLRSWWGERALEQGVAGSTGQINMINDHVRSIPIIKPDALVQKYIGDKVRQADQLNAWATQLQGRVTAFHQRFIPNQSNLDFTKSTRFVSLARMTDRFDAHFYPGVVEDYLSSKSCKFKQLGELTNTVFNGQTQDEILDPLAVDQITVAHLTRTYVKGRPRRVIKPGSNDKFTKQHDLLICNAAHNKSYIGRDVTYYHSETSVLPSTEVMVIRVDREELPASFVRTYLLTQLGFVQIQSTIRGITAHSYPVDIKKLDIPVPEVPDSLRQEWFACDETMALAGEACELANKLTVAAKFIVEALIEGLITEQQLVAAQTDLHADETSLDRDILARLTNNGLDGDGDPLFPDLDHVYDLLAESQSMDE